MELELAGRRFPIPVGEATIGSDASCAIRISGAGVRSVHAVLQGAADGSAAVRPATPDAEVLLNGVRLSAEPAPILHGDKLEIDGQDLICVDPRRSGSTQFISGADFAKLAVQGRPNVPATAATGGRLVCLTDGREYTVGDQPLVFGREAGCDIVVPTKEVSRRHAEIMATPQGYVLVDSSVNGTFVNGDRVSGQRILARADVIRVGDHEFRFYADMAAAPPPPGPIVVTTPLPGTVPVPPTPSPVVLTPPPAASAPPAPPPPRVTGPTPAGAQQRLHDTMYGAALGDAPAAPPPPVPRPSGTMPLASMLVRSGALKGNRLQVRVPVVNIGRGDYNDLVIPDESVSTQHAKLQRREEVWILTDLGSTNGTFVDGERINPEAPLSPGTVVRFGEVSVLFDPTDDTAEVSRAGGTKVLGAMAPPPPAMSPPSRPAAAAPPAAAPAPPQPQAPPPPRSPAPRRAPVVVASSRGGMPRWVVPAVIVVVLAGVVAVLLFR
jgi:pSer/pThr/pTyr-binding forkhead associated (FHA) protein